MNFLFIFFIFLGSLKTNSQDNFKIAAPKIFTNETCIPFLYILPKWLFDKAGFSWLLLCFSLFASHYFSHLIVVILNTESFTSFNKWLSDTDNCYWTLKCILYTARCWLPSWENLISCYLPLLFSFFSGGIINSIYSHHLSHCLTQLILTGGLKQQCKFMPNSYSISNVQDELSLFFCALWRK